MLTCMVGNNYINCIDGEHTKEELKQWSKKNILYCPVCGNTYEYCHGEVKIPYFRHKDKDVCKVRYSETETQEHLQGKKDLYEWIQNQKDVYDVILEGWLPETHQRPDIMFKYNNQQYVIEYQCTPIATEYYERHRLYQTAGINDIWILGTSKYIPKEENENSNRFRIKAIEQHVKTYYDSEFKNIISDINCINQEFSYITCDDLPPRYYEYISNRNIDNIVALNIFNKYDITKIIFPLGKSILNNGCIYVNNELTNILQNINNSNYQQHILHNNILGMTQLYLKNRYDITTELTENNLRLCDYNFYIKKDNTYIFDKKLYYYSYKYKQKEFLTLDYQYQSNQDISWNSFLQFMIRHIINDTEFSHKIIQNI